MDRSSHSAACRSVSKPAFGFGLCRGVTCAVTPFIVLTNFSMASRGFLLSRRKYRMEFVGELDTR